MEIPKYKNFKDLTGKKFGRLLVTKFFGQGEHGQAIWFCVCDCGKNKKVTAFNLTHNTNSCGCLKSELVSKRMTESAIHGHARVGRISKEFQSWKSMIERCENPKVYGFHRYGGRGIKVCKRWMEFKKFLKDMGTKPEGKTLGRINNDGNYTPSNCRWETILQQANNRSNNHRIEFLGKNLTLAEWERIRGFPKYLISRRISSGWPEILAIATPQRRFLKS